MTTPAVAARRALLFDMDGTMFDNMAYHGQAWLAFFARRGLALDEAAFFADTAGRQNHEIFRSYLDVHLSDLECAQLAQEKESLYRELYTAHRAPMPGLLELLALARAQGFALAVGTAAPLDNIHFLLDALDLRRHFDTVVGAAEVAHGKPAPDIFLLAAERCGVPPAQCIVFEDAPLGVEAARRAGMPCVVLTSTSPASNFAAFENVLACLADFSSVPSSLAQWCAIDHFLST